MSRCSTGSPRTRAGSSRRGEVRHGRSFALRRAARAGSAALARVEPAAQDQHRRRAVEPRLAPRVTMAGFLEQRVRAFRGQPLVDLVDGEAEALAQDGGEEADLARGAAFGAVEL